MTPNRIFVFPAKTKLEVVAGDAFVDAEWPRIHRGGAQEVSEFIGRFRHVTDPILIQTGREGEIVFFGETKPAQISGVACKV